MPNAKLYVNPGSVTLLGTGLQPGQTYKFDLRRYDPGSTTDYDDTRTSADGAGNGTVTWPVSPAPGGSYVGLIYDGGAVIAVAV
ncbi:MAG: hypothetical protein ACK4YP_01690 [Myxococcota bacterium]